MASLSDFSIHCVSLRHDLERRRIFHDRFEDVNYQFIDGVLGRELPAGDYYNIIRSSSGRAKRYLSTPAEVGCFLSHKEVFSRFLDGDGKYLMVLEDDVIPNVKLSNSLDIYIKPGRVSILGGQDGLKRPSLLKKLFLGRSTFDVPLALTGFVYRTCCYAMDRFTAEKIYASFSESFYLADDWRAIVTASGLKGISYVDLFSHPLDLSGSSIEGERVSKIGLRSGF